ncbi:DUF3427 domain-containing protein [Salsuginibacillus kocurii]|uniref:DUF3427 domain-containing protein n=1 Tax=Salsuginibacillus kocurii TaxID=427078 RepID=UPI00037FD2C1|nr:DEAD/DEAH box helicase [Salsuginibacillus kocurii]
MEHLTDQLRASLEKGFINKNYGQKSSLKPKLVLNKEEDHMLNTLLEEMDTCETFVFSVAFITESGLSALKAKLSDLYFRGVHGKVLTSTYLAFNQPKIFRELMKIRNLEVRTTNLEGFHSKGYIFQHRNYSSLIVGSSNLTASALKVNYEWNIKVTSHDQGDIVHHFHKQFLDIWENAHPLTFEWITEYEKEYQQHITEAGQVAEHPATYQVNPITRSLDIQPNQMQTAALQGIEALRKEGARRSLIVSATGTGKTFLSAFDVRRYKPKRFLFIAHREQILSKAKQDFQQVLGAQNEEVGLLTGNQEAWKARYTFATIQTLSKDETLSLFDPTEFDYILIDEVHKAGASSYQKIINYFQPDYFMGMTATPERTDGFNIFELFNYNIAYEIRLQEALEENMLCPFHYFGVTDIELQSQHIEQPDQMARISLAERTPYMLEKIEYYGYSGERVRGLIFCSNKNEAVQLSNIMNDEGYRTVPLTGDASQERRLEEVDKLENGQLDYILTVDIFNEGVDIPSVNQIVMMRQTESSIIFIQQLGRGLRKAENKEFLTVIDFIGNHQKNYLIPIALSGDQSLNKDNVRRYLRNTNFIKGLSVVNFEEIAKEQVYRSIDRGNLTAARMIKEEYDKLKFRLGRIPMLMDFLNHDSIDPEVIIQKQKTNYYDFLVKTGEVEASFNRFESGALTLLSHEFLPGKRKHELLLMNELLASSTVPESTLQDLLLQHGCYWDPYVEQSLERVVSMEFFTKPTLKKYNHVQIIEKNGAHFQFTAQMKISLQENERFASFVKDAVQAGLQKSQAYECGQKLTRYQKYTRKDVVKLLTWDNDESATVFGYKTKHNTTPIFITYEKSEDVSSSVAYGDKLLTPEFLQWFTRNNRTLNSGEVREILEAEEKENEIHIFVKKSDDEGTDFYYLGTARPIPYESEETTIPNDAGEPLPIVKIKFKLDQPVDYRLYQYLTD